MSNPNTCQPLTKVALTASNALFDVVALIEGAMALPSFGDAGEPQGRLLQCALEKIQGIHDAFDPYI